MSDARLLAALREMAVTVEKMAITNRSILRRFADVDLRTLVSEEDDNVGLRITSSMDTLYALGKELTAALVWVVSILVDDPDHSWLQSPTVDGVIRDAIDQLEKLANDDA